MNVNGGWAITILLACSHYLFKYGVKFSNFGLNGLGLFVVSYSACISSLNGEKERIWKITDRTPNEFFLSQLYCVHFMVLPKCGWTM